MKVVFKKYGDSINDITRDAAVCLDFDQKIDVLYEVLDVLKNKDIVIKFHLINDLNKAKAAQLKLIEEFNKYQNFINESIHQKILASAKKYGDLRKRNLHLKEISFITDSFYTKAFGGFFVLRYFVKPILF